MRPIHFVALLGALCLTPAAFAQDPEFAFGLNYSHLFLDGSHADELEEQGGLTLNGRVSWPISPPMTDRRPELRFGVGLNLSFYRSEHDDDDDDDFFNGVDITQVSMITPELQLSVRAPVGRDFYLEPGIAGQFIVGNYWAGEEDWWGWDVDEEQDIWRVGGGARVFLRGAYQFRRWALGIEGAYSYGWLDFGHDIGGDTQQGYLGVFFAHSF
jgi:hypothetical protein